MFVNTELFREAALTFNKYGYYCNAPEGTKDYWDFWNEEHDRCTNGYKVGDVKITGNHYFYLNYFPIMRFSDETLYGTTKNRKQKKELSLPAFWDGDFTWFWCVEIARNGISKEEYELLKPQLLVTIPDHAISGGKHVGNVKARRKGYSFKNGAILLNSYYRDRDIKNYVFASEEKYIYGDATLDKVWTAMNHNDKFCAWRQPRLNNKTLFKKSGYIETQNKIPVEKGRLTSIEGITFFNDPEKGRGKDGNWILFEEAGKFPNLIRSWIITQQTVEQGDFVSGTMIFFGTGGSDHEDAIGLTNLVYNPEAYNVLPVINIWDEELYGSYCSFFHPVYWNKEGYMDKDGNSDITLAIKSEEDKREKKKKSTSKALQQYTAEMPMNPQEATLQNNDSIMPVRELIAQRNRVTSKGLNKIGVKGYFEKTADLPVVFKRDEKIPVIDRFPHSSADNLNGGVIIYEAPYRNNAGTIPKDLYYIANDPYAIDDAEDTTSLGATLVMKRNNVFSPTFPDCPVAVYVARPNKQSTYNRNLFYLAEFYGISEQNLGFENNRGDVIGYARREKKLALLSRELTFNTKTEQSVGTSSAKYGITMTGGRKNDADLYIAEWLLETVTVGDDGKEIPRLNLIYDLGLLDELILLKKDLNVDRVSALRIAMFYMKEKVEKKITKDTTISKHRSQLKSVYRNAISA